MPPGEPEEPGRRRAGITHRRDAGREQAVAGATTEIAPGHSPTAPSTAPASRRAYDAQRLLPMGFRHGGGGHRTAPAPPIPS